MNLKGYSKYIKPLNTDTVTVFNYFQVSKNESIWFPTVIKNCRLQITKGGKLTNEGQQSKDNATLFILVDKQTKPFLLSKEWLVQEDKQNFFTTQKDVDFFIEGEYTEIVKDQDYFTGINENGFFDYINKTKDNVFLITSYSQRKLIPHLEIRGN